MAEYRYANSGWIKTELDRHKGIASLQKIKLDKK